MPRRGSLEAGISPWMNCPVIRASIDPHTSVYVMCGSGKRSAQAVALLSGYGFDAVNVMGGITEWYRNGYPVIYATTTEKVTGNRLKKPLPRPLKAVLDKLRRAG